MWKCILLPLPFWPDNVRECCAALRLYNKICSTLGFANSRIEFHFIADNLNLHLLFRSMRESCTENKCTFVEQMSCYFIPHNTEGIKRQHGSNNISNSLVCAGRTSANDDKILRRSRSVAEWLLLHQRRANNSLRRHSLSTDENIQFVSGMCNVCTRCMQIHQHIGFPAGSIWRPTTQRIFLNGFLPRRYALIIIWWCRAMTKRHENIAKSFCINCAMAKQFIKMWRGCWILNKLSD